MIAIVLQTGKVVSVNADNDECPTTYRRLPDGREYRPEELHIVEDTAAFIRKYQPYEEHDWDYDTVRDIRRCLNGTANLATIEFVTEHFGPSRNDWEEGLRLMKAQMMIQAAEEFLKSIAL